PLTISEHVRSMPAPVAGLSPTSPVIAEFGTSVMAGVPARIANGSAAPRVTAPGDTAPASGITATTTTRDAASKGMLRSKPRRARVPRAACTNTYFRLSQDERRDDHQRVNESGVAIGLPSRRFAGSARECGD